jgi:hypothetical protein
VYILLHELFRYNPLVLAEGDTETIIPYNIVIKVPGNTEHEHTHYPHYCCWEIPPRHKADMYELLRLFPYLHVEYWQRLETRSAAIIGRNKDCYNVKGVNVATYSNIL